MAENDITREPPPLQVAFNANMQKMQRPIPGQSLTRDPENPLPFEQPPQFVDKTDALEYLFSSFVEENKYESLLTVLDQGMPLMDLTKIIVMSGFKDGLWNFDLMLILIEPVAYMLMALAERAGIDLKVMEDEGGDEEEDSEGETMFAGKNIDMATSSSALPSEISDKIKNVELPQSLLKQP
jgi:hypothetical protein